MLFNSPEYALFLPIVFLAFRLLSAPRSRQVLLVAASYAFYGAWDWRFLGLILLSTVVDYFVGLRVHRAPSRESARRSVLFSVVVNLGVLATFKYFGFFFESAVRLASLSGIQLNESVFSVVLPVGISFYTFQTMAYTIDVYRRQIEPERSFLVFALYVAFFPQLVAGPIERARRLLPQLRSMAGPGAGDFELGLRLIALGLLKKVAIADGVAPIVDTVFANPSVHSRSALALGVVAFALQIYGDFSGYTDIARGSAKLMGFELVANFRQPYFSASITEFWRRWHISLSEWLRDYLYIPLGGNRMSRVATYRNLMLTMLLGGLWHGADWSFVLWGALHGVYLSVERLRSVSVEQRRVRTPWVVVTLMLTLLAWIPFRAESIGGTVDYLRAMLIAPGEQMLSVAALMILGIAFAIMVSLDVADEFPRYRNVMLPTAPVARGVVYGFAALFGIVASAGTTSTFIYFQF